MSTRTITVQVPSGWDAQTLREVAQITDQVLHGPSLPTRAMNAIADGIEAAEPTTTKEKA